MFIKTVTKEEFDNIKGVSYSRLSKLAEGPQVYKASLEEKKSSSGLDLGSLVDVLLTTPENFSKEFYVMSAPIPDSEMMLKFCQVYAETGDEKVAHASSGYKIDLNRTLSKFQTEGKAYYDALILGKDKKVVDFSQLAIAQQLVISLKNNPFTKKYFTSENENIEILYQVPIVWEIEIEDLDNKNSIIKVAMKSLLDIIHIDHQSKVITPIDIKTGSEGFWKSYFKFRYYLQGTIYHDALLYLKLISSIIPNDYHIEFTKFIFADANLIYPPTIYSMTLNDQIHGRTGYYPLINPNRISIDKPKYKGYRQLASELIWHINNEQWNYTYDTYMSNGEIEINYFDPRI